jgi:hypothetical protein
VLGVGVGSGVYELEPPQERDELPPVIFFNAPETFRPMPFMMEQNKHAQLKTGYVSQIGMNVLTRGLLLLFLQQRNEREKSLEIKFEQKSNENPRAKFERV